MTSLTLLALIIFVPSTFRLAAADTLAAPELVRVPNQDRACTPLAPGASVVVDDPRPVAPRHNERRYRITRDPSDSHRLRLELNFQFGVGNDAIGYLCDHAMQSLCAGRARDQILKKLIADRWVEKTRRCFADYQSLLNDADGTQLEVQIIGDPKNGSVPLANIEIVRPGKMIANNYTWSADEDCSIFIHESLHWTGLLDGYPLGPDSCRHVEPRASIYNSVSWALGPRVEVTVCVCTSERCRAEPYRVDSGRGLDCPTGYAPEQRQTLGQLGLEHLTSIAPEAHEIKYSAMKGVVVKMVKLPDQPQHALYAMQLRAIEQPFCIRDNLYMDCTRNAYRTKAKGGCLPTSPKCAGDWLR